MAIEVLLKMKCDGCGEVLRVKGKASRSRRGRNLYRASVFEVSGDPYEGTMDLTISSETTVWNDNKEGNGELHACSPACLEKVVQKKVKEFLASKK